MSSSAYDPPAWWPWDVVPDGLLVPPEPEQISQWEWELPAEAWSALEPARLPDPVVPAGPGTPAGPAGSTDADGLVDPALVACGQIIAGLDALAGLPADLVAGGSLRPVVEQLMCGRSRTAGLIARYLAQVDNRQVYPPTAAGDPTAGWLRHRFCLRPAEAGALSRRSRQVTDVLPALGQAMVDGTADPAQADMITTGIDRLPATATVGDRDDALAALIARCSADDPLALDHAATDIAEQLTTISEDGDPPDESALHDQRYLRLRRRDGGVEGHFFADGETGATITAYLTARSAPDHDRHGDPSEPDSRDSRSPAQRMLDTLADALAHTTTCEQHPGPPVPTVIVNLDYHALTGALTRASLLGTGQPLPASVARQMCCQATLIPTVLNSRSVPVDLGAGQRLFSTAQRHALAVRDRGCSFPGCHTAPAACHAHHLTGWADHGPTDTANGALLCPPHHRQLHRQHWTGHLASNGRPEYTPPDWIDPNQQPRQHIRYQLGQLLRS